MNLEFTNDLRHAIEEAGGSPVYIADPATNTNYVILRAQDYEKMKPRADDIDTLYPLLADLAPEDWEDAEPFENPS